MDEDPLAARPRAAGLALAVALAASSVTLLAAEDLREQAGPPLRQAFRTGTVGSVDFVDFRETAFGSRELQRRRQPFNGALFATRRLRQAVMQGQGVYRYRERHIWLVHNFYCQQTEEAGQIPWDCEATVFVMKAGTTLAALPWPYAGGDAGLTNDYDHVATVDGNFEALEPHPTLPLFAGVRYGCCDSESLVSIHDLQGRALCPPADLYLGLDGEGVWAKVRADAREILCPSGRKVPLR